MIKNNRLDFIVSLFDTNNNILLDIGTDHGYLIKKAFDQNKIIKAIASDINELPLANAKTNLKDYNVKYYLTSGFKDINEKYNLVVIAGMGASLISNILKDSPKDNDVTYILQPNNKEYLLRSYLMNNGFKIINEHVIFDKKHYIILVVKRGKMNLTKDDLILGSLLKGKDESIYYYKHLLNWYQTTINKFNLKSGKIVDYYNIIKKYLDDKEKVK